MADLLLEQVTMTPPASRESDKFMLRLPDGMRDRLKSVAAENGRSLNSEIVFRLQETLEMDAYQPGENANSDPIGPELTDNQKRLLKKLLEKLEEE